MHFLIGRIELWPFSRKCCLYSRRRMTCIASHLNVSITTQSTRLQLKFEWRFILLKNEFDHSAKWWINSWNKCFSFFFVFFFFFEIATAVNERKAIAIWYGYIVLDFHRKYGRDETSLSSVVFISTCFRHIYSHQVTTIGPETWWICTFYVHCFYGLWIGDAFNAWNHSVMNENRALHSHSCYTLKETLAKRMGENVCQLCVCKNELSCRMQNAILNLKRTQTRL